MCYMSLVLHWRSTAFDFATRCYNVSTHTEADLGMFSMFGRTEAPTKRGPHKRTGKFLQHSNMPEIIEIIIRKRFCVAHWRHKVSSQVLPAGNWHTALLTYLHTFCVHIIMFVRVLNKMSMMTTLSLCVSCEFSRAIRISGRGLKFLWTGPA